MGELISLFDYKEKQVRVVTIDGDSWWVAKDIGEIFGDSHYRRSISRLDDDEKGVTQIDTPGGPQNMTIVNEAGLYSLLFYMQPQKSKLPQEKLEERVNMLKEFKRWVTHEVLPQIRKTGQYKVNNVEQLQNQYNMPKSMPEAYRKIAGLLELNQELVPKAAKFDTFMNGENYQTMNEVAKSLNFGRNKLFRILRNHHILTKQNLAYQQYIDKGYFKVIEVPIKMGSEVANVSQTLVNAKGIEFIYNFLLKMGFIEKREVQVG